MSTTPKVLIRIPITDKATTKKERRVFKKVDDFNSQYAFISYDNMKRCSSNVLLQSTLVDDYKDSLNGINELHIFLIVITNDLFYLCDICNITSVRFLQVYQKLVSEFIDICMENTNECLDYEICKETGEAFVSNCKEGCFNEWAKGFKDVIDVFNRRIKIMGIYHRHKQKIFHNFHVPKHPLITGIDSPWLTDTNLLTVVWEGLKEEHNVKNPYEE